MNFFYNIHRVIDFEGTPYVHLLCLLPPCHLEETTIIKFSLAQNDLSDQKAERMDKLKKQKKHRKYLFVRKSWKKTKIADAKAIMLAKAKAADVK